MAHQEAKEVITIISYLNTCLKHATVNLNIPRLIIKQNNVIQQWFTWERASNTKEKGKKD